MQNKLVVVLATFHQLQHNGNQLNLRFRAAIELVRKEHPFEVIVEEWWYKPNPSFASSLATPTLKWENVGTPDEPQFETWRRGLNCDPVNHDASEPMLPEYGPLDAQQRRETYMTARIVDVMKPYKIGLFIVGLGHLHSMLTNLRNSGFEAKGYSWVGE